MTCLVIRMVSNQATFNHLYTKANLRIIVTIDFLHTTHQIPRNFAKVLPALYHREQEKEIVILDI